MSDNRTSWTTGSFSAHPNQVTGADLVPALVLVYSRVHDTIPSAIPLDRESITIGRDADNNTIAIRESSVSRNHVRLERHPSGFLLLDLRSTNGTLVNGRRIADHVLAEQDVVRIGDSVFRYASAGAHRYTAYQITGEKDLAHCPPHGILDPLLVGGMQVDLVLDQVAKVARTTLSVVVHGESGTGKELVARELHRWSGRPGAFQAINCAAIPANLLESELFGYRRGAFTGAVQDKSGLVQAAHRGTVFLDEIGDMPLDAQAKLLRVLQEREVTPVGATQPIKVDVRFVAATHRDLDLLVAEGRFRGDLLARLREVGIGIPPLRERREDLNLLVRAFLRKSGSQGAEVGLGYMLALAHYEFPYNVRELESAVRLSVALAQGAPLDVQHLPTIIQRALDAETDRGALGVAQGTHSAPVPAFGTTLRTEDASALLEAHRSGPSEPDLRALLKRHQGNVAAVGRELGKERMQVHRWMKRYGITPDDYRD